MVNLRMPLIVGAVIGSLLGTTPVLAEAADQSCVARDGQSGTWHTNPQGKWVRCKADGAAKGGSGGNGLVVVGALGAVGIGVGLALGRKPSSP